jgi:hypothetical protein
MLLPDVFHLLASLLISSKNSSETAYLVLPFSAVTESLPESSKLITKFALSAGMPTVK